MDGKWTPGPWSLLVEQSYRSECTVATIEQEGEDLPYRGMIARLQSAEHIDGIAADELTANAHLIAAAPDLYVALEKALNFITNTESEMGKTLPCGDAARAALAKARGEA